MSSRAFVTAEHIRRTVQGYEECATEEAFLRMFERDKKDLRAAGVPIEHGLSDAGGSSTGYRISRDAYRMPEITLTPEQTGILAVAAELLRDSERRDEAGGAMTKLSAAGLASGSDPEASTLPTRADAAQVHGSREIGVAARLAESIAAGRRVTFAHTSPGSTSRTRSVEPWWIGSRSGRWYLAGFDLDRDETRVYRLLRVEDVRIRSGERTHRVPSNSEIEALVERSISSVNPRVRGVVRVPAGRGAELRARASDSGPAPDGEGDLVTVDEELSRIAALVAMHAPDAVPVAPPELVVRVRTILESAAEGGNR